MRENPKIIKLYKRMKYVCYGVYYRHKDCCLCSGMIFEDNGNIKIVYNRNTNYFEDSLDYEKNICYDCEEISKGVFKAFEAYLTNRDYMVKPSLNVSCELSSFSYQVDKKYYEVIIDSKKNIYSIFEIDKSESYEFVPSYIIIKIIESLKKAGFKQVKICEEE